MQMTRTNRTTGPEELGHAALDAIVGGVIEIRELQIKTTVDDDTDATSREVVVVGSKVKDFV